ncbi:MAG: rRNA maturation RNase YbeY [Butyrivibrio sp.]|nr:rRNA maturation RNase YbeY [Butyrivibrio sp.]
MTFYVENEVDAKFDFDIEQLCILVGDEVMRTEGCTEDIEVSLIITDDEGIRQMNSEFRQIDKPTDVLSFPNVSYETPGDFSVMKGAQRVDLLDPDTDRIMFGDIVINENRVRSQAAEYGHSEKREFAFLLAHSLLHLCGYDHMEPEEAKVMEDKQDSVLNALGITRN